MTRARLLEIAALDRRRERERQGQFLVEGLRAVESAIDAGAPLVEILATTEAVADPRVATMLARAGAPIVTVSARDVDRVSDARTSQGIVAVARARAADFDPSRLPHDADAGILVLDSLQDPGNVGTIVRTAAWFGLRAVVAGPGTADFESPKVVRAATGGLWSVDLFRGASIAAVLDVLGDSGFALYGADAAGTSLGSWAPAGRAALVLGGEAAGLSDEARRRLSATVAIPRLAAGPGVESLNVAVAAGVLMHHWRTSFSGPR